MDLMSNDQEKNKPSTEQPDQSKPESNGLKVADSLSQVYEEFDREDGATSPVYLKGQELPPIPEKGETHQYLMTNGLLLVDCGEWELARAIFSDVLKEDEYHLDALRWVGWCFWQEGNLDSAQEYYEILTKRRQSEDDFFELGEIYYKKNEVKKAKEIWQKTMTICHSESPRLFSLFKSIGNACLLLGDLDSAEENYNKALSINPSSDGLLVNLGTLCMQQQKNKESMEFFKKALEVNSFNDGAWCGVAMVARMMKDLEWAWSTLLHTLDINPENQIALKVAIDWAIDDYNYGEVIDRVNYYLRTQSDDYELVYSLAGLYFKANRFSEAHLTLDYLDMKDPGREDSQELRGLIRDGEGL